MPENLPTDFDDELIDDTESASSESTNLSADNGKDENGVPYCAKHHCRMKLMSGGKKGAKAAYYACPVSACEERGKRIKTTRESSIPADPQCCPHCKDEKGKPIVLERSYRLSRPFYTILVCSRCQFKSQPMPRPEFVASEHRFRRQPVPDIGAR